jgi:predicted ATPase
MSESEQRYPLQSWTLGGFRAIRDETVFELRGLNLLVGANSAGKSSVLYSLLLAAQTLGNPLADRALVLNGGLARLGLAEDCVHEEAGSRMKLGFGLVLQEQYRAFAEDEVGRINVDATFEMSRDGSDFTVHSVDVEGVGADEDGSQRLAITTQTQTAAKAAFRRAGLKGGAALHAARLGGLAVSGDVTERVGAVLLRQFLPHQMLVVGDAHLNELQAISGARRIRRGGRVFYSARRRSFHFSRPVGKFIRDYLAQTHGDAILESLPADDSLTVEALSRLSAPVLDDLSRLVRSPWFAEHRSELPFRGALERTDPEELIHEGVEYARRWFGRRVRHLGPLRASPQPLYNLPEAASGASVGRNGEYTAAVLSAYASRVIAAPLPDGTNIDVPLGEAVDAWLAELGLLAAVRSEERGKLGFELHLSVDGVTRDLDLTTVGVGVSQALPIIVLGLIAEPGSLILFEQPELHLHPDVQAGLGDFFLALARSGRQLLVETHSEYLITRLRRRQITDPELEVADIVRLFFFEREGATSRICPAVIGANGSMPHWPRGFLDTAAREVEAMVRGKAS